MATSLQSSLTREEALALLKTYNKDTFHIRHALTVEGVMRWYAKELGHADEEEFWGQVGLLHDIDFEMYPEEHCTKAPELLRALNVLDGSWMSCLQRPLRPCEAARTV